MPLATVYPLVSTRSLARPFTYEVPEGVAKGAVVSVRLGRSTTRGVVADVGVEAPPGIELSAVGRLLDEVPAPLVDLALWVADYYGSTPARALELVAPKRRAPRGERPSPAERESLRGEAEPEALTGDQREAVERIVSALDEGVGEHVLLEGPTGSGKTEVYLQACAAALERGLGTIVLVPEIALAPQTVGRFRRRFGDRVAILHSSLGEAERRDERDRIARGEARIVVGARSAVFAPMRGVGLIVVDEEHDASYKHEGDPRYDARLVAERRGAVVVAGSATPRPESFSAMRRITLPERVDHKPLPPVEIVDMRETRTALHPRTYDALLDARKAIVLLNRRGWSNFLTCRSCGNVWGCPSCDVTLVLHRAQGLLACHHCGHREPVPQRCDSCGSVSVARHGTGTERLEHELKSAGLPAFRLDADVTRAAQVLKAFETAERGVLVGTQLVAKGHDFPDVTLGVVLDADATLRFPDFRAEERTFALVAQLAGRAGRGSADGRVLVQTLAPDAQSIRFAARHDADGFLAAELQRRELLRYPPFSTLIRVVCSSERPGVAHAAAQAVRDALSAPALGPAPLFRLRNRERSQVVVKAAERAAAVADVDAAVRAVAGAKEHRHASFSVDVDPQ